MKVSWKRVVERDNLFRARKQVQSNGGSPGIDGMTVEELAPISRALAAVEAGPDGRDLSTSTQCSE